MSDEISFGKETTHFRLQVKANIFFFSQEICTSKNWQAQMRKNQMDIDLFEPVNSFYGNVKWAIF